MAPNATTTTSSNSAVKSTPSGAGQLKLDPAPVHHYFDDQFIDQVRRQFLKQFCLFEFDESNGDAHEKDNGNDIDSGIDIGIDSQHDDSDTAEATISTQQPQRPSTTTTTITTAAETTTTNQQQQQQQQNNRKDGDKMKIRMKNERYYDDNDDNDDDNKDDDVYDDVNGDVTKQSHSRLSSSNTKLTYDVNSEFDPLDIEQIKSNDWFLRRFLVWKPMTVDEAVQAIRQALIWRKKININAWKDTDFPAEFYQIGACFSYLPDREKQNVLILRLRCNKRDSTGLAIVEQLVRNYFIYVVEKVVTRNPNRGFALIFDCHKASLANVDLDLARFVINTLSCFYPGAISYICIYDLPWIFNQIWRLIRSWLDDDARRIVKFATKSNITELISQENLPEYMGGLGRKDFRFLPKGIPTIEELAPSIGIHNAKDVHKLSEHFQKLIKIK